MKFFKKLIFPLIKILGKLIIRDLFKFLKKTIKPIINFILDLSPYSIYLFIKKPILETIKKLKNTYRVYIEIKKYADYYFNSKNKNDPSFLINSKVENSYKKNYALILANSYGVSEPRLLRQCEVLEAMGITPLLLGVLPSPGELNTNPNFSFLRVHTDYFYQSNKGYYLTLRKFLILIELLLTKLNTKKISKLLKYITIINYYLDVFYLDMIISLEHYLFTSPVNLKFVISHDYYFLPIGDLISKKYNIPHLNDIHEYALLQRNNFYLKYIKSIHIDNIHKLFFKNVNYFSIVSQGIRNKLIDNYPFIKGKSNLVRNVPSLKNQFEEYKEDKISKIISQNPNTIKVLYSGLITTERGLEQLLKASRHFNKHFEIYLVGPVCNDAKEIIKNVKRLQNRKISIKILESVDYNKIISFNKLFDIGYLAQPIFSPQKKYSLANKVFEYMHAGLALFLDKSIEYTKLIQDNDNGWLVDDVRNTKNIVNLINSIDRDTLQKYKINSLNNAKNYIWEKENNSLKYFLKKNI